MISKSTIYKTVLAFFLSQAAMIAAADTSGTDDTGTSSGETGGAPFALNSDQPIPSEDIAPTSPVTPPPSDESSSEFEAPLPSYTQPHAPTQPAPPSHSGHHG